MARTWTKSYEPIQGCWDPSNCTNALNAAPPRLPDIFTNSDEETRGHICDFPDELISTMLVPSCSLALLAFTTTVQYVVLRRPTINEH
jgi:hypothetical protein